MSKNFFFKLISIFLSVIFTYILFFFYFFINLEKNFEGNFKNKQTLSFYKKYSDKVHHIRYRDAYRFQKKGEELIYNVIKNESEKKIILFLGDSWFQQINEYEFAHDFLKNNLSNFSKIINAGTASYSPSLINSQLNIIVNDFKIKPNVVVVYIDQTDMGDELCRYKNLLNLDKKNGNLLSVSMKKFPYYRDVFNLHEKISFSEIELAKKNKIFKTQLLINYKFKKSLRRLNQKLLVLFFNKSKDIKCEWKVIESYKEIIKKDEKEYFLSVLNKLFHSLNEKKYIEKIYIVTHPHKLQLTTNKQPIDVSKFISEIVHDFNKIDHINFSKIIAKKEKFYQDLETIWLNDSIHLNEQNYRKFLKEIVQIIY